MPCKNMFQDQMSDCRSFGGKYHPSSQTRKISIGILIDSLVNKGSGAIEGDEVVLLNAERGNSNKESSVEVQKKGQGTIEANAGKQSEASKQIPSPWVSTGSLREKIPTYETVPHKEETSNLPSSTGGRRNRLARVRDAPVTHLEQFFTNQTSILHPGEGQKNFHGFTYKTKGSKDRNSLSPEEFTVATANDPPVPSEQLLANQTSILHPGDGKKKFGGFTYKRNGSKDRNSQSPEELTFATAKEVVGSDKEGKDDKTDDRRTENLRIKLREVLGTVASPKSQPSNSEAHEIGANNLNQERRLDLKGDCILRPRQNSDTIETDSESPDHTMKRPVTRSFTRKRTSTNWQPENTKAGPSSCYGQKLQDQNIFSFADGLFGKGDVLGNGSFSASMRKKGKVKSCNIPPCKICFTESNNEDEIQGATHRGETSPPPEKYSSFGNKMGVFPGCPPQNKRDLEPQIGNQERDYSTSSGRDSHQSFGAHNHQGDINSPVPQENLDKPEDFGNPSFKNVIDSQQDFPSPIFKINTPILSFSFNSTPKTDPIQQVVSSPELGGRCFNEGNIRGFRSLGTSKADCYGLNSQTESLDVPARILDSPSSKLSPFKEKKDVVDILFESSSEHGDSQSSEGASPIIKGSKERDTFFPETATAKRSELIHYPSKRFHKGNKVSKLSSASPSPKGIGETDWLPVSEPSKQHQKDELERVIMMFAMALENFKNKMKSATRRKSSEILTSVSEEIHQQLRNIELQIQTDLGKLTGVGKSKRKRLETRFQEQQEQLKLINEKFKQDIYQHLQDCQITLEGLEVHQIELKGTLKKQKASHQKLLIQVEKAVETQLNDAQRRITAVHKLAREQMLQLRQVVAEWLNEGVLS